MAAPDRPIRTILIVGGGTAGWMTAAALAPEAVRRRWRRRALTAAIRPAAETTPSPADTLARIRGLSPPAVRRT